MALEVVGSSPTAHPIINYIVEIGVSPSGKARDFDSFMRRFESCIPSHINDSLAQSVEHLTFNQGVRSSNLRRVTTSMMLDLISLLILVGNDIFYFDQKYLYCQRQACRGGFCNS